MTHIKTTCPSCGDVRLDAPAISLAVEPDGERGTYAFVCPECRFEVNKRASRKTIALLVAAGVQTRTSSERLPAPEPLPLEDRSPMPEARPFTLDDAIAFHFLLEDDVFVEEMLLLER